MLYSERKSMSLKEEKWGWQFKYLFGIIIVWGACSSVFFDNKCYVYKKNIFNLVNWLRCILLIIPIKKFPLPVVDLIIIILPILLLLM